MIGLLPMTYYYLLEVLVQLLWSCTPSFSNYVLKYLPVSWYIAMRWTLSGSIFFVMARYRRPALPKFQDVVRLAPIGILGYGLASYGTLYGLKWGGVVTFALLSSVNPVIQSGLSIVALKEKPKPLFTVAALFCVAGLISLVLGKYRLTDARVTFAATSAVFLAYGLEALAFVGSRKYRGTVPLLDYMAITELSAAVFVWAGVALQKTSAPIWGTLPLGLWGAVAFVSVVSCVICYGAHYWLLSKMEGHVLALFESLHSVFAALLGLILFHERVHPAMVFGGGLLIIGLYLNTRKAKPSRRLDLGIEDVRAA